MYKKNKLIFDLPDYIQGKIIDKKIIKSIEEEIRDNEDFRNEYETLKAFLKSDISLQEEEAPNGYYNNLLPQILDKLEKRNRVESFYKKYIFNWKLATVFSIFILVIIFYKNIDFSGNSIENNFPSGLNEIITTQDSNGFSNANDNTLISDNSTNQISDSSMSVKNNITKSSFHKSKINKTEETLDPQESLYINENDESIIDIIENTPDNEVNNLIEKINNIKF